MTSSYYRVFHRKGFVQSSTGVIHKSTMDKPYYMSDTPIATECGMILLVDWKFMLSPRKFVRGCFLCPVDLDYVYPEEAFQYDLIGFPLYSDQGFK